MALPAMGADLAAGATALSLVETLLVSVNLGHDPVGADPARFV